MLSEKKFNELFPIGVIYWSWDRDIPFTMGEWEYIGCCNGLYVFKRVK